MEAGLVGKAGEMEAEKGEGTESKGAERTKVKGVNGDTLRERGEGREIKMCPSVCVYVSVTFVSSSRRPTSLGKSWHPRKKPHHFFPPTLTHSRSGVIFNVRGWERRDGGGDR